MGAHHLREPRPFFIQLGFTPGKHHPTYVQLSQRGEVLLEIRGRDLFSFTECSPDIAHHAAAVALILGAGEEDENR